MPSTLLTTPDKLCASAVKVARESVRTGLAAPGEHLGAVSAGERLVTHYFVSHEPGYVGWRWAVSVARASRSKNVTVCETWLEPDDDAVLAPDWLPWSERLAPGDLGVGDLLPAEVDDPRLVPGYVASDDPAIEDLEHELGVGRVRVLSRDGRASAAERWYDGDAGPGSALAHAAPDVCSRCGFFASLAGSLGAAFGVCGNEYAPDDGRVVAVDHGCGAHSEGVADGSSSATGSDWPAPLGAAQSDFDIVHRPGSGPDAAGSEGHSPGSVDDAVADDSSADDDLGHG